MLPDVGEDVEVAVEVDVTFQEPFEKPHRVESQEILAGRLRLDANVEVLSRPVCFMATGRVGGTGPVADCDPPRKVTEGGSQEVLQHGRLLGSSGEWLRDGSGRFEGRHHRKVP